MNRRELLAAAGFGAVLTVPQIYPTGIDAAVDIGGGPYGDVVPSKMEYMIVNDTEEGNLSMSYVLTFLAADRGYEVVAVTGPDHHGIREYLLARRRPLGGPTV